MRCPPARWLWTCLAAVALTAADGCAPPMLLASAGFQALSNGTAVYVNGELEVAYRVPFHKVWEATQNAIADMQFKIVDARIRTETKALLFAEEVTGRSTTIAVTQRTPIVTKVTIRVGLIGDQSISRLIMDRIEAKMVDLDGDLVLPAVNVRPTSPAPTPPAAIEPAPPPAPPD
ncbi:MAG: DUF3568 family protein [Phycisphaerales bacterium]|nr:DUF3568 family protein [Phycisphaerales bacterium]